MRLRRFCIRLAIFCGLTLVLFFVLVWPTKIVKDFSSRSYSTKIYDRNRQLLKTIPLEDGLIRSYADVATLSTTAKKIFLKSEDSRFYFHFGVDPISVFRAVLSYIKTGRVISGGSTISMQNARMLTQKSSSPRKKIVEAINAIKLEFWFTKESLLEFYLSNLPYGNNIEGVEAASNLYFKSSVTSLKASELALLAVVPRSPSSYSPVNNPKRLASQISKLLTSCKIQFNESEINQAVSEAAKNLRDKKYFVLLPHFCLALEEKISAVDKGLLRSGASVITTIDLDLSNLLENEIRSAVKRRASNLLTNAAAIVMDVNSSEVIGYAGSIDFYDEKNLGQNDGVKILNQPGSTLKPFLYEYALEHGYTLASVLPDVPISFGEQESYRPLNFDNRFSGPVRIREALASSLNVPAVYLVKQLGVGEFTNRLVELGFNSLQNGKKDFGAGIVLGNGEVSLEELTSGYCTLANGGTYNKLVYIKEILCPPQQVKKYKASVGQLCSKNQPKQILNPDFAYATIDALSEHSHRAKGFGTASGNFTQKQLMLKSGTSDQFNNIWAVAATPSYACGVWMGNFAGQTVGGETGSGLPSKVAVSVLKMISRPNEFFRKADGHEMKLICPLSGMAPTENCPHQIYELLPKGHKLEPCNFHAKEGLTLPPIYDSWATGKGISHSTQNENSILILEPINHAIFYLDPVYDKVGVEFYIAILAGGNKSYQILLDKKVIYTGSGSGKVLAKAEVGTHTIELLHKDQVASSVTFYVK